MLELMGSGYVIEHCVSAFSDIQHQKAYEAYVTDCLMYMTQNSATEEKHYLTQRFADMIAPQKEEKRSGEEIISGIKNKLKRR